MNISLMPEKDSKRKTCFRFRDFNVRGEFPPFGTQRKTADVRAFQSVAPHHALKISLAARKKRYAVFGAGRTIKTEQEMPAAPFFSFPATLSRRITPSFFVSVPDWKMRG